MDNVPQTQNSFHTLQTLHIDHDHTVGTRSCWPSFRHYDPILSKPLFLFIPAYSTSVDAMRATPDSYRLVWLSFVQ
jgi:hypothetical protein